MSRSPSAWKVADSEVPRGVAEHAGQPLAQRGRGGRGEGDRKYGCRRNSTLLDQIGDPPRKELAERGVSRLPARLQNRT